MKLFRIAVLMLLLHATVATFSSHAALAASVDGTEGSGEVTGVTTTTSATDAHDGTNSKGGVMAGMACGFAVASLALVPNPVSAFLAGFNCMLMLIDAGVSPDR